MISGRTNIATKGILCLFPKKSLEKHCRVQKKERTVRSKERTRIGFPEEPYLR